MLKDYNNMSDLENLKSILFGNSFANYLACKDKNLYFNAKYEDNENLNNSQEKTIKILSTLEDLGFPMDELGTYLYKEIISELMDFISKNSKREDMPNCKKMLSELSDGYSSFYHYLSREWLEMGITSFHLYIEDAIKKIDDNKVNQVISKKIFGPNPEELDYGFQAFQLASYLLDIYHYDDVMEYKKPHIKRLSNIPDDLRLKDQ